MILSKPAWREVSHRADDAAGRAGQDTVLALELAGIGQSAVRLHEHQAGRAVADLAGHLVDIAAQDRREIGVDHRGIAAADQLHQRRDLVADRDLGEADLPGDGLQALLVVGVAVAVHQQDGDCADALVEGLAHVARGRRLVERRQDLAPGVHPLADLDRRGVEQLGQLDAAGKDLRPVLVGDAQGVAKAAGHHQQDPLALALQQGVGGDGGAHLHRRDRGRQRRVVVQPEQAADAGHGRIAIAFRVVRQQLMGDQRAVGALADDVGESAAAIDPELPGTGHFKSS